MSLFYKSYHFIIRSKNRALTSESYELASEIRSIEQKLFCKCYRIGDIYYNYGQYEFDPYKEHDFDFAAFTSYVNEIVKRFNNNTFGKMRSIDTFYSEFILFKREIQLDKLEI